MILKCIGSENMVQKYLSDFEDFTLQLEFVDLDNNGQVLVDLDTRSSRIKCKDMNLPLSG
jgi:hypothetical protein